MSNIAQGVTARKLWIFPPLVGQRIVVGEGAVISTSLTSFAGLAEKPAITTCSIKPKLQIKQKKEDNKGEGGRGEDIR